MNQLLHVAFDNYSLIGDLAVIAICLTVFILLKTSYVSRTRSLGIFVNITVVLFIAAAINIAYHVLLIQNDPGLFVWIYVFRILYQTALLDIFCLFCLYITQISGMNHKKAKIIAIVSSSIMLFVILFDVIRTILGYGFKLAPDGSIVHKTYLFAVAYIVLTLIMAILLYQTRTLLYRRVLYGIYGTMLISVMVRVMQLVFNQSSLNTMTFIFPVIAMLYIMHSTPYNIMTGSLDAHAMEDTIRRMYEKDEHFVLMSLLIPDYDEEGLELPSDIQAQVRKFSVDYFKKSIIFHVSNGHLILFFPKRNNPNFEKIIDKIMESFYVQFERFKKPYKIVISEDIAEISQKNEYISLIRNICRGLPENSIKRISKEDIDKFNLDEYIISELTDIYRKHDLDDPRVLVYCQPVFNLKTQKFDTAEALMRLKLDKTGMVYPNDFIPIAENYGYIHVLTEIILNKTCKIIRELTKNKFLIERISVNVSVLELKADDFCDDIVRIIENNEVDGERIAIELTESHSEASSVLVKEKIEELRKKGIHFYLDDFGTGYSNMERILGLPFDIIKFDRSMVIASGMSERSEKIVDKLAHMFIDMGFSVLFEGIESEADVARCSEMFASYLQGYIYSMPIPVEQLETFLQKTA